MAEETTKTKTKTKAVAESAGEPAEARMEVTAQLLAMRPGLYSVALTAMPTSRSVGGMELPCARIDPLPHAAAAVHVACLTHSPLLLPGMYPTYVRVAGEASMLLTIYKLEGPSPPPELRIRYMGPLAEAVPEAMIVPDSLPLNLSVHVERHGDITVAGGLWAMAPGGGAIEGFAVQIEGDLVEYQAVLGRDWASPWMGGGEFCGSRGLALPLIGVRLRVLPAHAARYSVLVWGRFVNGGEKGPFVDGAVCAAADEVLVGLRVALVERPVAEAGRAGRRGRK